MYSDEIDNPPEMFVSNNADWPITSDITAKLTLKNPVTKKKNWVLNEWLKKNKNMEFESFLRRGRLNYLSGKLFTVRK